jgi:hypothetical protein
VREEVLKGMAQQGHIFMSHNKTFLDMPLKLAQPSRNLKLISESGISTAAKIFLCGDCFCTDPALGR